MKNRVMWATAVLSMACAAALAQDQKPEKRDRPQPALLKTYVADRTTRLEREIADLIRLRADATSNAAHRELRIDLRIVLRHLTQQLLTPEPQSDAQAVIWLRHKDLANVIALIDAQAAPKVAAKAGDDAVRKATFSLKPLEDVAAVDALLQNLGAPLADYLGAGGLVVMRPAVQVAGSGGAAKSSLDQIAGKASQLSVSPALRQQLIAASAAARTASGEEATALTGALRSAVELATAMQTNVGIDAAARVDMETQIGEAIALYSDPRLRDAGQKRLEGLSGYRKLAGQVAEMNLPPETVRAIQPALNYARANPDQSAKVIKTLDAFAELEKETVALRTTAGGDALGRQADAQARAYLGHRTTFLETCQNLQGATFTATPEDLEEPVKLMRETADRAMMLRRLQKSQAVLLELKPRPTGGLEKRLNQSLAKLESEDAAAKTAAMNYVRDLGRLADGWSSAKEALAKPADPAMVQKYAGQTWANMETKLRAMAADSASAAASPTGEIDAAKLDALSNAAPLLNQLRTLADFESKLSIGPELSRWADCDLTPEKLNKLLDSFRGEVTQGVASTFAGTKTKGHASDRYRGLLAELKQLSAYNAAAAKLPEGNAGLVSRLTTPSNKAPFSVERYLSYMTDRLDITRLSADADMEAIGKLEKQMLDRLNREFD